MRRKQDDGLIRIPVSCLAEFVSSPARHAESLIRPYKFNKRGEGLARSTYYQHAINAIRDYHSKDNDPGVFQAAVLELQARADAADKPQQRARMNRNIWAIEAYRKIYKERRFTILPNHRITYRIGGIEVKAPPDLWVKEDGTHVLLKIGMAKKNPTYVDTLLTVMRKAAISSGFRVRAKNVVYLKISTGEELICRSGLTRFNRAFQAKAREIAEAWPTVEQR